ncbi:hypothetical protein AB0I00_26090 [Streptomyces sp. NPDC050803]|uniref:hypothetical protein n=1 Tax=unclassified Streptomyces TaxID=2593676 RepID=UPI003416FE1C
MTSLRHVRKTNPSPNPARSRAHTFSATGGTAQHTALTDCLTEYCRRHELTLCGVCTDPEPAIALHSPAFVGLPDTYGAVIPALGHLGPRPVAAERKRRIRAMGTRLIAVRSTRPATGAEPSFRLQQQGGT